MILARDPRFVSMNPGTCFCHTKFARSNIIALGRQGGYNNPVSGVRQDTRVDALGQVISETRVELTRPVGPLAAVEEKFFLTQDENAVEKFRAYPVNVKPSLHHYTPIPLYNPLYHGKCSKLPKRL